MCVAIFYRLLAIFIVIIENKEPEIDGLNQNTPGVKKLQLSLQKWS